MWSSPRMIFAVPLSFHMISRSRICCATYSARCSAVRFAICSGVSAMMNL
jgi:hypothetical protein